MSAYMPHTALAAGDTVLVRQTFTPGAYDLFHGASQPTNKEFNQ